MLSNHDYDTPDKTLGLYGHLHMPASTQIAEFNANFKLSMYVLAAEKLS